MSAFGEILRTMVERVPGAIGAIFADWEGESIDLFAHVPTFEVQLLGAHWGVVLTQTTRWLSRLKLGPVEEFLIHADRGTVLMRTVTDRYYVVLAAGCTAHLATARRELALGATTLLGEMS